jgi:protein TonB
MDRRLPAFSITCLMLLTSCSAPPPAPVPPPGPSVRETAPPKEPVIPPLTLEGYKKAFAQRVAYASPDIFEEPLPEILKSIVVLDVTIDRDGRLMRVSVRRSNGYKALENRAMDSVRRAAPFAAPSWLARHGEGSISFLETFLFRDDGRFQIRSLVAAR